MEELFKLLTTINIDKFLMVLIIVGFGVFSMMKIFTHMKEGFGIYNIRITGIVIVATLTCILAVLNPAGENAAIGILGAIAGYLFGYGSKDA